MYSASQLDRVDVAGMVIVAVPDEVCRPRAPRVVETVVESPRNIADDHLHGLLVLISLVRNPDLQIYY